MATFNPSDFYTLLSSFSDNVKAPCLTGEFNIYKSNVCVKALPSYQGRLSLPIYKDIVFSRVLLTSNSKYHRRTDVYYQLQFTDYFHY